MEAVAPTTIDRTRLLPRSGIGVDGAWLVIAPPGNPIIRLDARLLDRVELIGRSPTGPLIARPLTAVPFVLWVSSTKYWPSRRKILA